MWTNASTFLFINFSRLPDTIVEIFHLNISHQKISHCHKLCPFLAVQIKKLKLFLVGPRRLLAFYLCYLLCVSDRVHLKPQDTCPFVRHLSHTHTHTEWEPPEVSAQPFGTFLMLNQEKTKWERREGEAAIEAFHSTERHPLLNTPLPPPTPIQPYIPPPSSRARVDFSLNAIREVTGPIHEQMEGWPENGRNLGCRWSRQRNKMLKLLFIIRNVSCSSGSVIPCI